ncbi:polyphosphate kinase 2 [Rhodobacteraceae bacterium NNCM2]|nr:polyphosphate kinase 2 [Coraliihabitans acroporae]
MGKGTKPAKAKPRLDALDLTASLPTRRYEKKLAKLQRKLMRVQQAYLSSGRSAVIVFEGWDAAGKGGAIRRISSALDPRSFKVWPIGAPRNYYLERHYFTRFMERLPPNGAIAVFDRSWYGRVLVERVEKLAPKARWQAAFDEINAFEKMLIDDKTRIVKIFMHISPEEQLERFRQRLVDPMKRWKLTFEDFRNRKHWDDYEEAVDEMFAKTSTRRAPWCAVPANDKKFARIAVMKEIVSRLSHGVDLSPPRIDAAVLEEANNHFALDQPLVKSLAGLTD